MQNEEEYNDHDYIENLESQGADLEVRYVEKVRDGNKNGRFRCAEWNCYNIVQFI